MSSLRVDPITFISKRECGDCKSCCEGWLAGEIYDIRMFPGTPCHFSCETGCSIYENRPQDPCRSFDCLWKSNNTVPSWMKPNKSKVILVMRTTPEGINYMQAHSTGEKISVEVMSWLFRQYAYNSVNIVYDVDGSVNYFGNADFIKSMEDGVAKTKKETI